MPEKKVEFRNFLRQKLLVKMKQFFLLLKFIIEIHSSKISKNKIKRPLAKNDFFC